LSANIKIRGEDFLQLKPVPIFKNPSLIALLLFLFTYLVYMPGYMSNDSLTSYSYAGQLDSIVLYHPPVMAWFFSVGRFFSSDQSAILLIQLALFYGALYFFISSFICSFTARSIALIIIGLFPAIFPILGVLWKSVWMTSLMLFAMGFTLRFYNHGSNWNLVGYSIFSLLAMLARFDAVVPVALITTMIVYRLLVQSNMRATEGENSNRRDLIYKMFSCFCAGVIALVYFVLVSKVNGFLTVATLHPLHVPLYQDILNVSTRTGKIYLPQYIETDNPNITIDQIRAAYSKSSCNAFLRIINRENSPYVLRRPKNEIEYKQFWIVWWQAVRDHPRPYLAGRRDILYSLWGFGSKAYYPFQVGVSKNSLGLTAEFTAAKKIASDYGHYWAYEIGYLHRPFIYILVGLVLSLVVLFRKSSGFQGVLMITLAGIAHFLAMSVISCAADFRFAFFMIVCVLAGVLGAIFHGNLGRQKCYDEAK
jgi:hypothetical protein